MLLAAAGAALRLAQDRVTERTEELRQLKEELKERKAQFNEAATEAVATSDDPAATARDYYWGVPDATVAAIQEGVQRGLGFDLSKGIAWGIWKDTIGVLVDNQERCDTCGRSYVKTSRTADWECPDARQHTTDARQHDPRNIAWREQEEARAAVLQRLKTMPYGEYLQTVHWHEVRQAALKRARYHCQICNSSGPLDVHHRTYERRGEEWNADVIAICRPCHERHHFPEP